MGPAQFMRKKASAAGIAASAVARRAKVFILRCEKLEDKAAGTCREQMDIIRG